ncbi:MAG: amidohydrolase [Candidatus Cloacimonetes bacterium]|nr:amidohydrolase [Candidatus Cloacimonadota bacterium]
MKDLIGYRHTLHRIPELAFEEFKTQRYLLAELKIFPLIAIHCADRTGIVVEYQQGSGPFTLFRADMDALPVTESTGCSFVSTHPGLMHACGHDMHMAILLGLIKRITTARLPGNFLFVFQPAEESKGGASYLLASHILDAYDIDAVYGLHVSGSLPVGTVGSRPGPFFAATREVDIHFSGIAAHMAYSQRGINALAAATWFYQEWRRIAQNYSSQEVICDFGRMQAGTVRNVLADSATLEGTIRTFDPDIQKEICHLLEHAAEETNQKYHTTSAISYPLDYQMVNNDPAIFNRFLTTIQNSPWHFSHAQQVMTGEDFGFFTNRWPGLLFWLGADDGSHHDLHTPDFLPADDALAVGVDIFYRIAQEVSR